MLERTIEAWAVRYASGKGVYCRKWAAPSNRGVPDRIFIGNGQVVFVEFKAPGKKATPLQRAEHDRILAAGGKVMVIDSKEDAKELVDALRPA